jgi:hypothetical protein
MWKRTNNTYEYKNMTVVFEKHFSFKWSVGKLEGYERTLYEAKKAAFDAKHKEYQTLEDFRAVQLQSHG